jgi:hypothetical protein
MLINQINGQQKQNQQIMENNNNNQYQLNTSPSIISTQGAASTTLSNNSSNNSQSVSLPTNLSSSSTSLSMNEKSNNTNQNNNFCFLKQDKNDLNNNTTSTNNANNVNSINANQIATSTHGLSYLHQHQLINHNNQQLAYTSLINNSNYLNQQNGNMQNLINPTNLNPSPVHSQQQANLIASINAANFANLLNSIGTADFQNIVNQQQTTFPTSTIQSQPQQSNILNGVLNGLSSNATTTPNITHMNLNDEHQIYEYMHQLLEEKEKLKELYNEPFNILLPLSARLLEEG